MSIHKKLATIQSNLVATKSAWNDFSKYNYRSNEAILQALKPHLRDNEVSLIVSDQMVCVGGLVYVEVTTTLTCIETGESVSNTASAREPESRKGMDASQITGAASSYARKYCLSAMFAIDDNKDADSMEKPELDYTPDQKAAFDRIFNSGDPAEFFIITKKMTTETHAALFNSFPAGKKTENKATARGLVTDGNLIITEWIETIENADGDETRVKELVESNKPFVVEYIRDQLSAEALAFFNEVQNG